MDIRVSAVILLYLILATHAIRQKYTPKNYKLDENAFLGHVEFFLIGVWATCIIKMAFS